jgi:hypothetical protein
MTAAMAIVMIVFRSMGSLLWNLTEMNLQLHHVVADITGATRQSARSRDHRFWDDCTTIIFGFGLQKHSYSNARFEEVGSPRLMKRGSRCELGGPQIELLQP